MAWLEALFQLSFLLVACSGYWLAKSYLFYGFDNNYPVSLSLFLLVFIAAAGLLQMVLMEVLSISTDAVRQHLWGVAISVLNYSSLFLIPGLLLLRVIEAMKLTSQKYILFGIAFGSYLSVLFYRLIDEAKRQGGEKGVILNFSAVFTATVQFNYVSKIGVGIISALSGFSIVYMPFEFFRYYDPMITQINKRKIEEDISTLLDKIKADKMALAQMALETEKQEAGTPTAGFFEGLFAGLFGQKLSGFDKRQEECKKSAKLNQQIMNTLFTDYSEISVEEKNFLMSEKNRCRSLAEKSLAVVLLCYGCYKLLMTVFYLCTGRNKPTDPISTGINLAARLFDYRLDAQTTEFVVNNSSLLFMGVLIIANVRGFALTAGKFLRLFFKSFLSQFVSSEFTLLITTEVVAIYFLSTFFLLQLSLPERYKRNFQVYLARIDYFRIYNVFDVVFLVSAVCSFLILLVNLKSRRAKYSSYAHKDQ